MCQPKYKLVHIVSDGAFYLNDGTIVGFASKVYPVPHWPGAIAARGDGLAGAIYKHEISHRLSSFDEMVTSIEATLQQVAWEYASLRSAELIIAGYSEKRCAPEVYSIYTVVDEDEAPGGMTKEQFAEAKAAGKATEPFTLRRHSNAMAGPVLTPDIISASGFPGIDTEAEPERVVDTLRFALECQRHSPTPQIADDDGKYFVGGFGQLTMVSPDGCVQRVLNRWEKDEVGEKINPGTPDWPALSASILGQPKLSRLKQQMAEKKDRKLGRTAA